MPTSLATTPTSLGAPTSLAAPPRPPKPRPALPVDGSIALGATCAPRLLAGPLGGMGASLREHVAVHGPLALPAGGRGTPAGGDRRWADWLLDEVEGASLSGRGGGGFPSARKLGAAVDGGAATILVNAMEGEPASRKDHVLLRRVPHLVLDGAELRCGGDGSRRGCSSALPPTGRARRC